MDHEFEGKNLQEKFDFSDSNLSESTVKVILQLLHYKQVSKFAFLVRLAPFSTGTLSNYLNALKDRDLVERNRNEDGTVDWSITDIGVLYLIKEEWISLKMPASDQFHDVINSVEEYIFENNLDESITSSELQEATKEIHFLNPSLDTMDEPEKAFLRTFTDLDLSNHEYAFSKKEIS